MPAGAIRPFCIEQDWGWVANVYRKWPLNTSDKEVRIFTDGNKLRGWGTETPNLLVVSSTLLDIEIHYIDASFAILQY